MNRFHRRHQVLPPRLVRKRRKKARGRALLFFAAAVALFLSAIFLFSRETFLIADISFSGPPHIDQAVLREMTEEKLSGSYAHLISRSSIFFYPARDIEHSLLEAFPEVASVRVGLRSLQSLSVTLQPREAVGQWCIDNPVSEGGVSEEPCFLFDADGFIFKEADASSEVGYPSFFGGEVSSDRPVGDIFLDSSRILNFLSLLSELAGVPVRVAKVHILEGGEAAVLLSGGARLLFLEGADVGAVVDNLKRLVSDRELVPRDGDTLSVEYIDLRFGNKVYVKPR